MNIVNLNIYFLLGLQAQHQHSPCSAFSLRAAQRSNHPKPLKSETSPHWAEFVPAMAADSRESRPRSESDNIFSCLHSILKRKGLFFFLCHWRQTSNSLLFPLGHESKTQYKLQITNLCKNRESVTIICSPLDLLSPVIQQHKTCVIDHYYRLLRTQSYDLGN